MSVTANVVEKKPKFSDTVCGHIVGILLLCYGAFNTCLFVKFTPVYTATQCGDQEATLQRFSLGNTIKVGLQIQVTCWNPNGYQVQIMTSSPGHVYVGQYRNVSVGELTLLEGSFLPEKGTGDIRVHMDAELSPETSAHLVPHFLSDKEIPMFLELQFDVGVNVNFGLKTFGTTAPFKKKCGMLMAGLLVNTATRLGPMVCRESFAELAGNLPHVGEAHVGTMSFSGAQMDPDRIAMGEMAKNVSIIGVGGLCYIFGLALTYHWIATACWRTPGNAGEDPVASLRYSRVDHRTCLRATSGNLVDAQQVVQKPAGGTFTRAIGYVLGGSKEADLEKNNARTPREWGWNGTAQLEPSSPNNGRCVSVGRLLNFMSCGAMAKRRAPPQAPVAQQPGYQPSCLRAESGNVVQMQPPPSTRTLW